MTTRRPVRDDLRQLLPATIELTATAPLLTIVLGVPLGLHSALKRGSAVDHLARFLAIGGVSMPIFWLGLVLQVALDQQLLLLPIGGRLGTFDLEPGRVLEARRGWSQKIVRTNW